MAIIKEFKLGDWVTCEQYTFKFAPWNKRNTTYAGCQREDSTEIRADECELWKPEAGDIYWDKYNGFLCRCSSTSISASNAIEVFGYKIEISSEYQQNIALCVAKLVKCEPFIGELPSSFRVK